jgi:Protein of unknown function (DUF1488)
MPLQRGDVLGYDFDRMVVDFTMFNQSKTVRCAISTAAMDNLEGKHDVKANQRVDQFLRLRDAIEERASRKFFEGQVEAERPVVCTENLIRIDLVTESLNVSRDGRDAMVRLEPGCLVLQISGPA